MSAPAADPPSTSLRAYRAGFWFGGFNGLTWMIGLGTPMVLLAERLGASTFQVGLASSFVFLLLPVQILSTATLPRLGYRRQMVLAWITRALFLLVPLGIATAAPQDPGPWLPSLLVASVFGFCTLRAFGAAAHIPWFAGFLPIELRGRYFATDTSITSLVGVATLLFCAALFARLPDYEAFRTVYGLAILGSTLAVVNLLRLPSTPAPRPTPLRVLWKEGRRLLTRRGLFRHYLALTLLASVVSSSMAAFAVYYLKIEAGLPSSRILLLTAAQFGGSIVGSWAIRARIDRTHIRAFFRLSLLLVLAVQAFWLGTVLGHAALLAWLVPAYLVFGLSLSIFQASHFTFLPELSSEESRPISVAVFTATHGLLSGIAPILWGLYLKAPTAAPGIDPERFAGFFALGIAISCTCLALYGRLDDTRGLGARG